MSKINQRKNFSTRLVQAPQDQFKLLFDTAPVALVEGIWGTSFKVIRLNPAALSLFAAESEQQFVNEFYGLLTKIPSDILLEILSARIRGDLFEVELRLPTLRRSFIYVFMRIAHVPSSQAGPQHVVLAFHDITSRKKQETFLKKLSQIDGLTQVYNQRTILERLDEEIARAHRYNLNLSCVILDLDNFKEVNDTLGHLYGDKCIKQAAAVLKSCLRKTDVVGRYGGDEFLVILTETASEHAGIPIGRFLKKYEECAELKNKGKSVKTTFSIGISGYPEKEILSAKDLINAADKALYLSKTSGGNCYNVHAKPSQSLT